MKVKIIIHREPDVREPYLVGGLPGIGYVAKLSVDYLVEELKAQLFGEVYSEFFSPYVLVKSDGTVELMKNEFYFYKNVKPGNDLIIFTGNAQAISPEGQYAIANEVLETAERFNVKKLFTVAAYVTDKHVEKPKVYAAATEPHLLEDLKEYGVIPMEEGSIGGTNGLLFGLAKLRKIHGICLLGETAGYTTPSGRSIVDAKSAQAVLEVLTRMLDMKIDLAPLEKQARMTEQFIQKLEDVERRVLEQMYRTVTGPKERTYYI